MQNQFLYEMERAEHSKRLVIDLTKTMQHNDEEIKRLTKYIADQEAALQQLLDQRSSQATVDLQLQKQIGTALSDIADSHQMLAYMEDENHIAATRAKSSQKEASSRQQQAATLRHSVRQEKVCAA